VLHDRQGAVDQQPGDDRVVVGRVVLGPEVSDDSGERRVPMTRPGRKPGDDALHAGWRDVATGLSGCGAGPEFGVVRKTDSEGRPRSLAQLDNAGVAKGRVAEPSQARQHDGGLIRWGNVTDRGLDCLHRTAPASAWCGTWLTWCRHPAHHGRTSALPSFAPLSSESNARGAFSRSSNIVTLACRVPSSTRGPTSDSNADLRCR